MTPLQDIFAILTCPSSVQAFSRCHQTSGQDHLTQARHFLSNTFTLCTKVLTLQVSLLVMSIIWLHSVTFTPLVRNITREVELDTKNCLLTPLTPCRVADDIEKIEKEWDILVWGIFDPRHRLSHFWCQGSRGQQSRSASQAPERQLRWPPRVQLGDIEGSSYWSEAWLGTNCMQALESWSNPRVKDRIAARRDFADFMSDGRWQGKFYNSFNAIQSS